MQAVDFDSLADKLLKETFLFYLLFWKHKLVETQFFIAEWQVSNDYS